MTWQPWLLVACSIATALLGWVTYKRGRHNDDVLNVAANIQATYDAQKEINEDRRKEIVQLRIDHRLCEEATDSLRSDLAESLLERDKLVREHARLKAMVNEHEQTIARHEHTINELKAARLE